MTRTATLLALLLAAVPASSETFASLAADYWEARMRLSPLTATFYGHKGYDSLIDDESPAGRSARKSEWKSFLSRLRALDRKSLAPAEKVSVEALKSELETSLDLLSLPFNEISLDHMDGGQSWIPTVIQTAQPMADDKDADALIARLKAMPKWFTDHEADLRAGLKSGRVAARVPTEKAIRQIEEMLDSPLESSPYAAAADRLPEEIRARRKPEILKTVEETVLPAYRGLLSFLQVEYLPKTREKEIGLSAVPGGKALYRAAIRAHTTTDKDAGEIHEIGLAEVAGIRSEMKAVADRLGWVGDLESFLDSVRKDPKNFFTTREEVVASAEALVAKTQSRLPDWFGVLPKTPLVVKAVEAYQEKNEAAARYFQPPSDLSRPGVYYINTYKPESRPRFSMASLAAHEGVPGHHMQIALALENKDLPAFRRHGSFTAFVEGWALYSERLADEMGLYEDDLSRLGMLSDQALRACRLVVDTGIHAKGWSRAQAIDYMKANTPMSQEEIEAEVDRYTVWPGQALAYKIGQREIAALREEAKARLGRRFDARAFHDAILRDGPLPLSVLRARVEATFTR